VEVKELGGTSLLLLVDMYRLFHGLQLLLIICNYFFIV